MTPSYAPRYFRLEEFLPPRIFQDLAATNSLWKGWLLIDERLLRTADQLREKFGALTINDWHNGGTRDECGLRVPGMVNFKPYSQHSFGRAIDAISRSLSGEDMRKHILGNQDDFPFITALERGVSWLHADVRNCQRIELVNP